MTPSPKEKAQELVDKFFEFNYRVKWDDVNNKWIHNYDQAKQCALIAVDEIQKSMEQEMPHPAFQQYWQEVKEQILNQNK